MENIIRRGTVRCYMFQSVVLISGILLLVFGDLGIEALWNNWVILLKTVLLILLMILLSYVHFELQPKIEAIVAEVKPEAPAPENLSSRLKPYRVRRKGLATLCLFFVITIIILGMQVYSTFPPILTLGLIALAALFAWRANKTLIRFGWF